MDEEKQFLFVLLKLWLSKVKREFKSGKYFHCVLIAIMPFAGAWAGARLFWFAVELAWNYLEKNGAYLLLFFGVPALFIFACWYLFAGKKQGSNNQQYTQSVSVTTIAEVRTAANETYPQLQSGVFELFKELCGYLPGLVVPVSKIHIRPDVPFDILGNYVVIYHFVINRGNNERSKADIESILNNLVQNHLQANDFVLPVGSIYQSADGSQWPGLFIDSIYEFSDKYRVDICITGEPEVAYLKNKFSKAKKEGAGAAIPPDPDFGP